MKFEKLETENLPDGFDLGKHTEKPLLKIDQKYRKIIIDYIFPGFYLDVNVPEIGGKKFQKIIINSTGSVRECGKPLLPSFGRYVQIPHNSRLSGAVVPTLRSELRFDGVSVWPAQKGPYRQDPHVFDYDSKFYSEDRLSPAEERMVKIFGPYNMDGYCVLLVHVTPFQYNPAKKELIGYGSITVSLGLEEEEHVGAVPQIDRLQAFSNLILNPGIGIEERLGFPTLPKPAQTPFKKGRERLSPPFEFPATPKLKVTSDPEFLIVYGKKEFEPAVVELANWKESKGISTEIIPVDNISILLKDYIRNRSGPGFLLKYVLLFGDVDTIPTETVVNGDSDYYYSTDLDEPCNVHNHPSRKFLEPQLAIGRIPVNTEAESIKVLQKIKKYEQPNPATNISCYEKLTLTTVVTENDALNTMKYVQERFKLKHAGYTALGVYQDNTLDSRDPNASRPDPADPSTCYYGATAAINAVIDATRQGRLAIAFDGHGCLESWDMPYLHASDLPSSPPYMPTILYNACCFTGQFTNAKDCFAETTLKAEGPVTALVAATAASDKERNHSLVKGLFDATFGDILDTFPDDPVNPANNHQSYPVKNARLGDILNYAKFFVPTLWPGEDSIEIAEWYHVIGDPTLEVWTASPKVFTLNADIVDGSLNIQLSPFPRGCILTLWDGDTMLDRIDPPSAVFTLPCPQTTGRLKVCCWAPGYRFAEVLVGSPTLTTPSGLHIT